MRLAVGLVAVFALMATQARAATTKFDLVCTGKATINSARSGERAEDWKRRIAFDLDAGLACYEGCKSTVEIKATPNEITFQRSASSVMVSWAKINRTTGEYTSEVSSPGLSEMTTAACELAAFSGLPGRKF